MNIRILAFGLLLTFLVACSQSEVPGETLNETLGADAIVLNNGVTVSNLSGARRSLEYFSFEVPDNATTVTVSIAGGSGDADLYVRYRSNPTTRSFDCRPYRNGNNESCRYTSPQAGTYYIMLRGYTVYSGVSLTARYQAGSVPEQSSELEKGIAITNLSDARAGQKEFTFSVPADAENLQFRISGGSGDADLYVRRGSTPTVSRFDCRPYLNGNNETCTYATPQADTYYVMLRAYRNYSGVSLVADYEVNNEPPPPPPPPPTGASEFDITFVYGSSVTNAQKQLFENAAARWQEVITGDIADTQLNKQANLCGQGEPAFNGAVDDVVIYADVAPRDGPGGILASAGPCLIRSGGLTTYGVMNFDSADATGPDLYETILHEMGHVLGIGTLWPLFGVVNYNNNCPATPRYTGSSAVAEWNALGGSGNVPIEEDGGGGTRCGHWDEETFDTELMTGFSEGPGTEYLSRMTIASLEDMGYTVNKSAADNYSLPGCAPNCQFQGLRGQNLAASEILLKPVGVVSSEGSLQIIKRE